MIQKKSTLWSMSFSQVILMTFLFFLCMHMLNASFPVYITNIHHNPAIGGMMMTAFMIASIVTRPFISMALHKVSMKKTIIMTLIGIFICIALSYNRVSLPFLLVIRVLEGIGFGIITTILATMATTIAPKNRLGEGVGYFGMATSLGASLSPVVALALLHSASFNTVLIVTFLIAACILVCCLLLRDVQLMIEPTDEKRTFVGAFYDKNALLPSLLVFFLCVTFGGVFNFIDGLGGEVGLGAKVSWFFLIFMIIMLFIRPISGKIFDKKGHEVLIYPAGICGIAGLMLLSMTNHLWMLIIAGVCYGIAYGTMHPTLQAWAVKNVNVSKKGTANAMILTCMDLGMAIGSPTLGMIANHSGYRVMYGYSAIFIVVLLLIYLVASRRNAIVVDTKKQRSV